jgi:hypothetical protein
MARMNISIPDPLYERLDRLRDRVNASKVCAQALEKELDMLEGRTAVADPDLTRLLQRLQGVRDRWYQRGRDVAKQWAVATATRDELWRIVEDYGDEPAEELVQMLLHHEHGPRPWFPRSLDLKAAIDAAVRGDLRALDEGAEDVPFASSGGAGTGEGDDGEFRQTRANVDEAAFLQGMRDVVKEIWKVIAPQLRR